MESEIASKGGKARASRLSEGERSAIARKAAEKRWGVSELPKAEYTGTVEIGELQLPCVVLQDGRRIFSESGMAQALTRTPGGSGWKVRTNGGGVGLPSYLRPKNLLPYISAELTLKLVNPILYKPTNGPIASGVEAPLLPQICDVFLKARREGRLSHVQERVAQRAEILIGGLATVGIIALVDAATGYDKVRDRHELERILEAYISKELLPWTKRFPDEFYEHLFRLRGWMYSPPPSRNARRW
jgi:hypothetical protein